MSHFNFKSFGFYAFAIGAVLVLFKVVTAFGETVKAPPPIAGSYRLIPQSLPECLESSELILNIQQSGIYVNGSLLALAKNPDSPEASSPKSNFEERPSLNGRWNHQKLVLSGSIDKLATCEKQGNITITGEVNNDTISGQITLASPPNPINFTARKETNQPEKAMVHH